MGEVLQSVCLSVCLLTYLSKSLLPLTQPVQCGASRHHVVHRYWQSVW